MKILGTLATLFLLFASLGRLAAYDVCDVSGRKFSFETPPKAITLTPAMSETICAVGAGEYLLGVSKFCKYPEILAGTPGGAAIAECLAQKEVVGGFVDANYEKILSLRPQIAVLQNTTADFLLKKFESLGIRVFLLHPDGLENIAKNTEIIGELFGKAKEGASLAKKIREQTADLNPAQARPRAIFLFDNMAAGIDTYAGQLLQNCGFYNIARNTKAAWAVLSREFVLASKPEVLILQADDEADFERKKSIILRDRIWSKTPAAKNGKIYFIPTGLIITPSPRVIYAARHLRKIRAEFGD
ncbi:MAG: ABC transporter substrate-binding protein [Opitutales bacterium]|nr:ABC transporter substrate-binding protein [Opitutales bacterium]